MKSKSDEKKKIRRVATAAMAVGATMVAGVISILVGIDIANLMMIIRV